MSAGKKPKKKKSKYYVRTHEYMYVAEYNKYLCTGKSYKIKLNLSKQKKKEERK